MSGEIKYETTDPIKEIKPLSVGGEKLPQFEILMKRYSPYFRLGAWIEFIWRW